MAFPRNPEKSEKGETSAAERIQFKWFAGYQFGWKFMNAIRTQNNQY